MTQLLDDFQRRTRALVSAVGLLLRSEPGSVGYGEFRRKTEKSVRMVIDTADEALRGLADGDREAGLQAALERGLMDAGEAERWRACFAGRLLPDDDTDYDGATLDRLRALMVDARGLETNLRGLAHEVR
ncbi:MAG TPA: hypothetical protein VF816_13475 [Rhodocyclaceae bacterium]